MEQIKSNIKKYHLANWISAVFLLIVGIAFIILTASNDFETIANSLSFLSVLFGLIFVLAGTLLVLLTYMNESSFLGLKSLLGAALIGVGIATFAIDTVTSIILSVFTMIPYILITIGAVILLEGLILLIKSKTETKTYIILIVGFLALLLGILCVVVDALSNNIILINGIVLILIAVYLVASLFVDFKSKIPAKEKTSSEN